MKPSLKDVLSAARDLIADQAHWTRGDWAENSESGSLRGAMHPDACMFCALGAVGRAMSYDVNDVMPIGEYPKVFAEATKQLSRFINGKKTRVPEDPVWAVTQFNDSSEHEDVLKLFDMAIEDLS